MTPNPHNPLPMMFEPNINWEKRYKIDRGGEGGQAILYGYKIANFPETLDHIPYNMTLTQHKDNQY